MLPEWALALAGACMLGDEMSNVVLKGIRKSFGNVEALKGIDLDVPDGKFVVFVGPSGCGKTTLMRIVAGLENQTAGDVIIDAKSVNELSPSDRGVAMVFQSYALYPHLSVRQNLRFPLRMGNVARSEADARVDAVAETLQITALMDRRPSQLSGGQKQRVAIGRTIVRDRKLFLFDEPLSNLDADLRVEMRLEIQKLHRRLGATMIYVTHDQVEAMTMGDRICVMKDGNIMQVAEPLTLYNHPVNLFVAGFIGSPPMNLFKGTIKRAGNHLSFVETNPSGTPIQVALTESLSRKASNYIDKPVVFGIRPENVQDSLTVTLPDPARTVEVKVEVSEPMGAETYLYLDTGASSFIARVRPTDRFEVNQKVKVTFDLDQAHLFDPATELAIA